MGDPLQNAFPVILICQSLIFRSALATGILLLAPGLPGEVLHLSFPERYALVAGILVIVLFRLAAVKWNWCLPAVREPSQPTGPSGT